MHLRGLGGLWAEVLLQPVASTRRAVWKVGSGSPVSLCVSWLAATLDRVSHQIDHRHLESASALHPGSGARCLNPCLHGTRRSHVNDSTAGCSTENDLPTSRAQSSGVVPPPCRLTRTSEICALPARHSSRCKPLSTRRPFGSRRRTTSFARTRSLAEAEIRTEAAPPVARVQHQSSPE